MTKPDKSGQKELSVSQESALVALLRGATDTEAGEAGGVTRQTVNGWRNHDAAFIAELNRRRSATREAGADKLRSLVSGAVDVLGAGLNSENERIRYSAALAVLKAVGIADKGAVPSGPQNEAEIRYDLMLEDARFND